MQKQNRAANDMNLAHSFDLQLFNDDYLEVPYEPTEPTEPIEQPVTEPVTEPTVEPIEPVVEDVTQTQAFSRRLNEERAKIEAEVTQKAVDAEYSRLYGAEYGIHSKADYDKAVYDQQLREAGNDPDMLNNLINEHPSVVRANELQKDMEQWKVLTSDDNHPEIKDISQIPAEAIALYKENGISLVDAYNRVLIKNQKAEFEKLKLQTEQETIKKIQKNATSSPGSASDGGVEHKTKSVADMTPEEFEAHVEEVRKQNRGDY